MSQTSQTGVPRRIGTIVVPAYNESASIDTSLRRIALTLGEELDDRRWEIVVVDDGSADDTLVVATAVAEDLASPRLEVRVLQHVANRGLGGALQTGFAASRGDVVVVVDCDLSYHPDHIRPLVRAVENGQAQIAVASPYMPGGRTVAVPPSLERRSRLANRFLALVSRSELHTFTGMVRAYDGPFIRELALRSVDDMINVEALHKTSLLHGRVVEVPATLDWRGLAVRAGRTRLRNRRTRRKTYETLVRGVLYRPYLVFASTGAALMSLGALFGVLALVLPGSQVGLTVFGISSLLAGFSAGLSSVISIQVKRGFEEMFFQSSSARRMVNSVVAVAEELPFVANEPAAPRQVPPLPRPADEAVPAVPASGGLASSPTAVPSPQTAGADW